MATGGDAEPLKRLESRIAELERELAEKDTQLELEHGKVMLGQSALAESQRRCSDFESRLSAAGLLTADEDKDAAARRPKPPSSPHWTPNGALPPKSPSSGRRSARAVSPLTQLQSQRRALNPPRRAKVTPDMTVPNALKEKNLMLTQALLRSEAEFKRERDRSNKTIAKLSMVVEKLAAEASDMHEAAASDVNVAQEMGAAREQATEFNRLYQSEVRKRQISEKKSHAQLLALRTELADKGERIRKLEQEMIEIQRVNPARTRQWLAMEDGPGASAVALDVQ